MNPPTLNDFLAKNVEGYLVEDLARLRFVVPEVGKVMGACGYPLVMTVCSGVELLGALSNPGKLDFRKRDLPSANFHRYWSKYLYPHDRVLKRAGRAVYQLARHGLAHAFHTTGPLVVTKGALGMPLGKTAAGEVVINSTQLAEDFLRSYLDRFKPDTGNAVLQARMEKRLGEMWARHIEQATGVPATAPRKVKPRKAKGRGRPQRHPGKGGWMRFFRGLPLHPPLLDVVGPAPGSPHPRPPEPVPSGPGYPGPGAPSAPTTAAPVSGPVVIAAPAAGPGQSAQVVITQSLSTK